MHEIYKLFTFRSFPFFHPCGKIWIYDPKRGKTHENLRNLLRGGI